MPTQVETDLQGRKTTLLKTRKPGTSQKRSTSHHSLENGSLAYIIYSLYITRNGMHGGYGEPQTRRLQT